MPFRVERLLTQLDRAFPDAVVTWPAGFDVSDGSVNAKDQHVAAAIIVGQADALLTCDGPPHREAAIHCDTQFPAEFLAYAIDVDASLAAEALDRMLGRWPSDGSDLERMRRRLVDYMGRYGWGAAAALLKPEWEL